MASKLTQPGPARPQPIPPTSDKTPVPTVPSKARGASNHPATVHKTGDVGKGKK